nr:orexin receptor [Haliclona caerulea]
MTYNSTDIEPPSAIDIALTVIFAILVVINLMSNTLVCWVIWRYRESKNFMNYLVVNLAVADIMIAVFITPQYVLRHLFKHPVGTAGDVLCKLVTGGNFIWIGGAASAFTLAGIAIERYLAVSNPERSQVSARRIKGIIIASWVYALLFNLPLFFVIKYEKLPNDFRCPEKWPPTKIYAKVFTIGAFIVMGAIPIGMMSVFYSLTIRALWKNRLHATAQSDLAIVRQRKKATKMMLVVSVLYTICWLPNLILYMLSQYEPSWYIYFSTSYVVSVVLVCANSTMNPFVYTFHSSRFRNELKSILCCIRHRHVDFLRSL